MAGGVAVAGGAAAAVILLAGKKSTSTPATETVPSTNPTQETVQMQAGWEVVK